MSTNGKNDVNDYAFLRGHITSYEVAKEKHSEISEAETEKEQTLLKNKDRQTEISFL